jgi:hypothetical protein
MNQREKKHLDDGSLPRASIDSLDLQKHQPELEGE